MNINETIGMAIFAIVLLIATAQAGFAWGRIVGRKRERQLADRRINGVLAEERARKPKSQKAKRKQSRKRIAPELVGGMA